jgi:hypothetical protein
MNLRSGNRAFRGRRWMVVLAAFLLLAAGGTAVAASGVSVLVTSGEDRASTAQNGEPIGTASARLPGAGQALPGEGRGEARTPPGGAPEDVPEVGGAPGEGAGEGAIGDAAAGGDGGALPFTGFLAIGVLAVGVVLLLGGMLFRRRVAAAPQR